MKYILPLCLLAFIFTGFFAQETEPGYNLHAGEIYEISQVFLQSTESEETYDRGNVSLDIYCTLHAKVLKADKESGYVLECNYNQLKINMFSLDMNISLNSSSREVSSYLAMLENYIFLATLKKNGEFLVVSPLDSFINNMEPALDSADRNRELIIKTLLEAYGNDALVSMANMSLNMYGFNQVNRCIKDVPITFNARTYTIKNTFFINPLVDENWRIQGIGVLQDTKSEITHDQISVVTEVSGRQTYDNLYDSQTGWIIEGVSKQKIQVISTFHGYEPLPDGLKIPSETETEITFKGKKLN